VLFRSPQNPKTPIEMLKIQDSIFIIILTISIDLFKMNPYKRQSLSLALIISVATAKIDWNLESTFLQYLQQ